MSSIERPAASLNQSGAAVVVFAHFRLCRKIASKGSHRPARCSTLCSGASRSVSTSCQSTIQPLPIAISVSRAHDDGVMRSSFVLSPPPPIDSISKTKTVDSERGVEHGFFASPLASQSIRPRFQLKASRSRGLGVRRGSSVGRPSRELRRLDGGGSVRSVWAQHLRE